MELDPAACHRAMLARDARYDGRFFTCVTSTGIYCRPICPARPPKLANCIFVRTAAAAQQAGFRSCLRCRPECAPEFAAWGGSTATVKRALALIEADGLQDGVDALAARLGLGERQLRRLFRRHLGASPIAVAQTRRVHLAKRLIDQTTLSMTEIALASGYSSVRRFNETFQRLYDRRPSMLRRQERPEPAGSGVRLMLPYRPPYDWDAMLAFLAARAVPGVECVAGGAYHRTIEIGGIAGSIEVANAAGRSALCVTVRHPGIASLPAIIARVRRVFDLGADPAAIAEGLGHDPTLAPLVAARPGLRVPGAWDGFEIAVRAVLGQQITVAAAVRLAGKLVVAAGRPVETGHPGLTHVFPQPGCFDADRIAAIGMPRARAGALAGLAAAAMADPLLFDAGRDLADAVLRLRALPGIGEWTAQYIAMRALRENDAFLAADVALQRVLGRGGVRPTTQQLLVRAEAWRPWRAYAVLHLWTANASQPRGRTGETVDALAA